MGLRITVLQGQALPQQQPPVPHLNLFLRGGPPILIAQQIPVGDASVAPPATTPTRTLMGVGT